MYYKTLNGDMLYFSHPYFMHTYFLKLKFIEENKTYPLRYCDYDCDNF